MIKNQTTVLIYLLSFSFVLHFTRCEKSISDLESPPDTNRELTQRAFHSPQHEKDYNDYLSGKLTVADILKKYDLTHVKGLSNQEWDKIIRGESNPVDFDTHLAQHSKSRNLNSNGAKTKRFSEMLIQKVFVENNPAYPEHQPEFQNSATVDERPIKENTKQVTKRAAAHLKQHNNDNIIVGVVKLEFGGNMLWFYRYKIKALGNDYGNFGKNDKWVYLKDINYKSSGYGFLAKKSDSHAFHKDFEIYFENYWQFWDKKVIKYPSWSLNVPHSLHGFTLRWHSYMSLSHLEDESKWWKTHFRIEVWYKFFWNEIKAIRYDKDGKGTSI